MGEGACSETGRRSRSIRRRQAAKYGKLVTGANIEVATDMTDGEAILAANAAYYRAFATGDFAEMVRIWAHDGVSCVHPGWPALIGREDILESYRNILHSQGRVRIAHHEDTAIVAGDEGRVLCVEIVEGAALAATNCYRRVDGAWRMIHHQASPIAMVEETAPRPKSQRLN
jgi:uncharacterized protein (TIGR02246 family)